MSRNLRRRLQRKKIIRRRIKRIVTVLIIVLIVILSLIAWRRYADNGYTMDGILGGRSEMSISEMEEALQDAVNESMFRVKVNQNPILNKDTGATSITVQNSIENRFNKVVRYYNSEGTVVYETSELYPGSDELSAVFNGNWKVGTYILQAEIIAIDAETREEFVVTVLDINLKVK